jgi:hypothetical protein
MNSNHTQTYLDQETCKLYFNFPGDVSIVSQCNDRDYIFYKKAVCHFVVVDL